MASIFTFLTVTFGLQAHFYTSDKKFYETLETQEQRQFRHRQVWAYQSYEYQSLIIAAIWYGIKILMSTHRSKIEVLEKIAKIEAEKKGKVEAPKDKAAKKNDW